MEFNFEYSYEEEEITWSDDAYQRYYLTANQIYNADIDSPNEMLVDSDDLVVDAENEKDDGVHDIHPDEEKYPRADDSTWCLHLCRRSAG